MNLLLIAPGASSEDVGEVLVAYRIAEHLVQHFTVTLITIDRVGRPSVVDESLFADVVRFKERPGLHRFERFNSMAKPWYLRFFLQARRWIKTQLRQGRRFDWVHQINPCAIRYPSPASGLGMPYSLGPVAGGLPNLQTFASELTAVSWYTRLRVLDHLLPKCVPMLSQTYRQADLIFAAAPYVTKILQARFGVANQQVAIMDELGTFTVPGRAHQLERGSIKLLYVGRIVRTKGVRDLVAAMARLPETEHIHLDIIGAGDDLSACQALAVQLNVDSCITFHGRLPREQIDVFYTEADLFVFPSFREPTGGVLVEAMSYGLPMIVADYGGPEAIVDSSFGRKIVPDDLNHFRQGIATAIDELAKDPVARQRMRHAALAHCTQHYLWEKKIAALAQHIKQRISPPVNACR